MTKQEELIEKIAKALWYRMHFTQNDYNYSTITWEKVWDWVKEFYLEEAAQILVLIKEAGWKSPDQANRDEADAYNIGFDVARANYKGYVKLAEDQSLPLVPSHYYSPTDKQAEKEEHKFQNGYRTAQQDMREQNWKKVEEVNNG